jgi:hypothetical protein
MPCKIFGYVKGTEELQSVFWYVTQCSLVEMKHDFACHKDDGVILLQNVGCVYQTGQRHISKDINLNK